MSTVKIREGARCTFCPAKTQKPQSQRDFVELTGFLGQDFLRIFLFLRNAVQFGRGYHSTAAPLTQERIEPQRLRRHSWTGGAVINVVTFTIAAPAP